MTSLRLLGTSRRSVARAERSDRLPRFTIPLVLVLAAFVGAAVVVEVWVAWAFALGIVALIALAERPAFGGLVLIVVAPVTSGLAAGAPVPLLRPSEAVILGVGALCLLLPVRKTIHWNRLDWSVAAYCIASIAFGAFHEIRAGDLVTNFQDVVAPIEFLLLYRLVASILVTRQHRSTALRLLLLLSIPVSVIGILQQLDVGPMRDFVASATQSAIFGSWGYQNTPRATSIFPDWHTFGGYLAVILLLGIARMTVGLRARHRVETMLAMGLGAAALMLTQTFTSIFAVAFGAVIILRHQRAWRIAGWVLVLGAFATAFFGSYLGQRIEDQWIGQADSGVLPQTVDYRIEVWTEQYLPLIDQYWTLGYGTGIPPQIDWEYTESGYLTLLFRGGVLLVIAAGVMIANSFRSADRAARLRSGDDRALALCAMAVALALIPMNLVWPYLTNAGLSHVFIVVLGLVRASDSAESPQADPAPVSRSRPELDRPG